MLYFHANAEDLGRAHKFLSYVYLYLKLHILAIEYPGYGVYKDERDRDGATAEKIFTDAECVYKFLRDTIRWKESDMLICGRSIGSGPACQLASRFKPAGLILVSPHTSIRGVVKDQILGSIA
jgi:esterase/lipase